MSSEYLKLKIQELGEVKSGKRLPLGHELTSAVTEFPYIRLVDVSNGRVQKDSLRFLKPETRRTIKRYVVNSGDVCLAIVGHTIGMVFYVDSDFDDVNLTENAARITSFKNFMNSKYLYYYLTSPLGQAEIRARKVGSAQGKLPLYNIKSLEIPIPPKFEQDEIVETLDALDDRITLLSETNATLGAIAQALFKSWFVDFDPVRAKAEGRQPEGMDAATAVLFPDSFVESELGMVPKGWRVGSLGDIASIKGGKQLEKEFFKDRGVNPIFGGAGVMGHTDLKNAEGFVITVGRVGAYCGQFFWRLGEAWVNNNASHIQPMRNLDAVWIYQWLRATNIDHIKKGAAQPFVSNGDLAELKLALPMGELVERFVEVVGPVYEQMASLQEQAQTLTQLRDTLLPRLISGQLRLPETMAEITKSTAQELQHAN